MATSETDHRPNASVQIEFSDLPALQEEIQAQSQASAKPEPTPRERHRRQSKSQRHTDTSFLATPDTSTLDIASARQAQYIAFLCRHPFATDAYELGFTTGIREDCRYQNDGYRNVDLPLLMLDNYFKDPDLNRYLTRFRDIEPEIGVIGDAKTAAEAYEYIDAARDLKQEFPDTTIIIVPKCREAIDIIGEAEVPGLSLVLGYSMGYSDVLADDFSDIADWRGHHVHLLGASPPKQWAVIQQLTQPTLADDPPANIVGMDWNGVHKMAYKGEYWTRDGWKHDDVASIRGTVEKSLREMRAFWQERGVWPAAGTTPVDHYGPAVRQPDEPVFAANGADIYEPIPVPGPEEWEENIDYDDPEKDPIEQAIVVSYDDGRTLAYRSETERDYVEYYEGLWGKVVDETPR